MEEKAKRYNKGKLRYELLPTYALDKVVEVYTKGAHKYSVYEDDKGKKILGKDIKLEDVHKYKMIEDGGNNWRKGQSWAESLGSIKRHISAYEAGEDIDQELETFHICNAIWGLLQLTEYYKIYPQGDDRQHKYLKAPKIGLDIDEVLCDWISAWRKLYNIKNVPNSWFFDRDILKRFDAMIKNKTMDKFYSNLKPLIHPNDIPFEPHCYITSRPCKLETTINWLDKNGFPTKPVYCVGAGQSKVEVALKSGIDIFVDDSYDNFVALNKAGICTYLYDTPHNRRYNVGHKRIKSLKELM